MNIFKIIQRIRQYDKKGESNQQMLVRIGIKFLILIFIILIFDSLLDWLLGGIHTIVELIHLLIKVIEYFLELILEYGLQIDYHQNEIIIVNIIIISMLYTFYHLYRHISISNLYFRMKRNIFSFYLKCIRRELDYWRSLTLVRKTILITCYFVALTCLLFIL
jgi:hypothetical protein